MVSLKHIWYKLTEKYIDPIYDVAKERINDSISKAIESGDKICEAEFTSDEDEFEYDALMENTFFRRGIFNQFKEDHINLSIKNVTRESLIVKIELP